MTWPDDPADFLVLDTEQRADLLLAELARCSDGERGENFLKRRVGDWFADLRGLGPLPSNVPARQAQRHTATEALEDAYAALMSKGLIRPNPRAGKTFCELTQAGREAVEIAALPNGARIAFARSALTGLTLHVALCNRQVDTHFLQGKFETALRDGSVFLEDAIRKLSGDPGVGVKLASKAFSATGKLANPSRSGGEQAAVQNLFTGFFGLVRNQVAHNDFRYSSNKEAFQALVLLDYLAEMLDSTAKRLGSALA